MCLEAARGEGAASAGLGGGADAVTEPVKPEPVAETERQGCGSLQRMVRPRSGARKPFWEAQQIIGVENVSKLREAGLMLIHRCDWQALSERVRGVTPTVAAGRSATGLETKCPAGLTCKEPNPTPEIP